MFATQNLLYWLLGLLAAIYLGWRLVSRRRDLPCPPWLGWMVELENPFSKYHRAGVILELLDVKPGMKVLDAGCGPGRLTLPAARAVGEQGEVLAVDIQEKMLARTRQKVQAAGLENVRYLYAKLGEGKLPQDRFDCALLVTVLGEIPDREAALREIYDALKPGGNLSVTELIFDPHFQRRAAVLKLAAQVGFKERAFFGKELAYTMHLEKPDS
jgi:ubiquinone/menaquinone biosynthesis C-methylase UbiE